MTNVAGASRLGDSKGWCEMREEMLGLRHRWHGFLRRRLERLRGRIDRRIERLEEKRQRLDAKLAKTERAPAEPAGEAPTPPARTRARRRAAPSA